MKFLFRAKRGRTFLLRAFVFFAEEGAKQTVARGQPARRAELALLLLAGISRSQGVWTLAAALAD
jgi:hypothetical protein